MKEEPVVQETPAEASHDFSIKTGDEQGNDGNATMQSFQQDHNEDYDRPISIKEDGYV